MPQLYQPVEAPECQLRGWRHLWWLHPAERIPMIACGWSSRDTARQDSPTGRRRAVWSRPVAAVSCRTRIRTTKMTLSSLLPQGSPCFGRHLWLLSCQLLGHLRVKGRPWPLLMPFAVGLGVWHLTLICCNQPSEREILEIRAKWCTRLWLASNCMMKSWLVEIGFLGQF